VDTKFHWSMRSRCRSPGLIVPAIAWAFSAFLGNVLYDTAKAATARLALSCRLSCNTDCCFQGKAGVRQIERCYVERWLRTLTTIPFGSRTKNRLTPHGSSVNGYTISHPCSTAFLCTESTSSTSTEASG
jgi:hypothetical protein